jgi:eukaryotic-like serine/threonine-protein kinase
MPVAELDQTVRERLDAEVDFVITQLGARTTSSAVSAEVAGFLKQFEKPQSVIDAVIAHSKSSASDPEQLLTDVLPAIQALCHKGFLVPIDATHELGGKAFEPGEKFNDFEVIACIQSMDDTHVYKVQKDGQLAALKLVHTTTALELLAHEHRMLMQFEGIRAPKVLEAQLEVLPGHLAMTWCNGGSIVGLAETFRSQGNQEGLLALANNMLSAYAELHERGFVHGDVHPRNILADTNHQISLIDFGWTTFEGDEIKRHRGGVAEYFEPEYASAKLNGTPLPPVTRLSEQYALGALLYRLFCGQAYLPFSLERDRALRQTLKDAPVGFAVAGVNSWPAVERVLETALSKKPEERFASVGDFLQALEQVCVPDVSATPVKTSSGLVEVVSERYGPNGPFWGRRLPVTPHSSVNYGAAGIAYFYLRLSNIHDDPQWLAAADVWLLQAKREANDPFAFCSVELDISEETVGRISIYHTVAGVHCVGALIAFARGDQYTAMAEIDAFVRTSSQKCQNLDLTLGQASALIGCSLLLEACTGLRDEPPQQLTELGQSIYERLITEMSKHETIRESKLVDYLGLAHGWAGLLFACLRWCEASDHKPESTVLDRLQELSALAVADGQSKAWPYVLDARAKQPEYWPGWCHGTAGYVLLFVLADRLIGGFLETAQAAARHTLGATNTTTAQLCCGLAGQAYALLSLYRRDGDELWHSKALWLTEKAAGLAADGRGNLLPHSLYKGDVGIALLLAEFDQVNHSAMPLLEPV